MEYGKRNLSKQIIKPAKLTNMFSGNAENQSKQNQRINKSKSADVTAWQTCCGNFSRSTQRHRGTAGHRPHNCASLLKHGQLLSISTHICQIRCLYDRHLWHSSAAWNWRMRRHGQVTPLYNGDCVWRRGYGYCHLASSFKFLVTWVGGRRNCSDGWGLWGAINSCLWWQLIGCGSKLHLLLLSRNVGINLDRLATFFSVQVLKLLKIP